MPKENYSKKQKKLAAVAEPRDKITGADLKKLSKKPKKMMGGGMYKMKDGGMYKMKDGGMMPEYGDGGLVKTRGTGAATKGLHFKG